MSVIQSGREAGLQPTHLVLCHCQLRQRVRAVLGRVEPLAALGGEPNSDSQRERERESTTHRMRGLRDRVSAEEIIACDFAGLQLSIWRRREGPRPKLRGDLMRRAIHRMH